MEFCCGLPNRADSNVVQLSNSFSPASEVGHRCGFKCEVEHVCGNLYRCKTSGTAHICDQNCDQRLLYDNNNTICRCSRKTLPLLAPEGQAIRGVRRKNEWDVEEVSPLKRNRDVLNNPSGFFKRYCHTADPLLQLGESCMDTTN